MNSDYFDEIVNKSVTYYENNYLNPEVKTQATKECVLDYSAYFYAYSIKLIQNTFRKNREEAQQSFFRLLTATEESLPTSVKTTIKSDYNQFYFLLLEQFELGLDKGEDSMEGFKIMLDSSAKIIAASLYWIESNVHD